jgi:class 3 adenylate cyclase/HAMP domain-containing protein
MIRWLGNLSIRNKLFLGFGIILFTSFTGIGVIYHFLLENEIISTSLFLWIIPLVFILCLFFVFLLTKKTLNPLSELKNVVKEIEKNNYDYIPNVYPETELGELAVEFNRLGKRLKVSLTKINKQNSEIKKYNEGLDEMVSLRTKELNEVNEKLNERNKELIDINAQLIVLDAKNDRLQALIRQYTPKATWSHVLDTLESESLEESLEEIEKTMLFADIKSFTKFAERYTPKIILQSLNEIFEMVTEVVYRNNGDIDKFIGDAFFAVFDEPFNSVMATWEISKKLDEINDENMMAGKTPLYFRFGINTGMVVRGNIGGEIRKDNTLIGDAVNIAQRLEMESIPGQILISKTTYDRVKHIVKVGDEIELTVKGKKKTIKAFYIENVLPPEPG